MMICIVNPTSLPSMGDSPRPASSLFSFLKTGLKHSDLGLSVSSSPIAWKPIPRGDTA